MSHAHWKESRHARTAAGSDALLQYRLRRELRRVAVCGSNGFNTEPRDSSKEPKASPAGGFLSAFNRASFIDPSIETLSRVHTRTVRGAPKGHSAQEGATTVSPGDDSTHRGCWERRRAQAGRTV